MRFAGPLTAGALLRKSKLEVSVTWLLVGVEVGLIALIPLLLGRAIDRLLEAAHPSALVEVGVLFLFLTIVGVGRRIYDTRVYGTMRVKLGVELARRSTSSSISQTAARVSMCREIVDFLEDHTPRLITNIVGVLVSVGILFSFDTRLGFLCVLAVVVMVVIYGLLHGRFFRLNTRLNEALERQVEALQTGKSRVITHVLLRLRKSEVQLSDANAMLFGLVFLVMFALILANLWIASVLPAITIGALFAILSYTWELVESAVELPETLQQWTRLAEIETRINTVPLDAAEIVAG